MKACKEMQSNSVLQMMFSFLLERSKLGGCPDPLWYLTSELGLKATCICCFYLVRRVFWGHIEYVYLVLTSSWVSSLTSRLDGASVCVMHFQLQFGANTRVSAEINISGGLPLAGQ